MNKNHDIANHYNIKQGLWKPNINYYKIVSYPTENEG